MANRIARWTVAGISVAAAALIAIVPSARAQDCVLTAVHPVLETGPANISGLLPLTASGTCPSLMNTATSSAPWLQTATVTVTSAGAFVSVTSEFNNTGAPRTATVSLNGQTLFTFTQRTTTCVSGVTPVTAPVSVTGGTVTFQVQTLIPNCFWSVTGFPPPPFFARPFTPGWATPTGVNSYGIAGFPFIAYDIGSQPANVFVFNNGFNTTSRSATLTFGGGPTATIDQPAPTCQFTFTPTPIDVPANGGTFTANLTGAGTDCSYTTAVTSGNSWLTVTSGGSGTAPATLTISAAPNTTPAGRSGQIVSVNGLLSVIQAGPPIAVDYPAPDRALPFGAWRQPDGSIRVTSPEPIRVTNTLEPNATWTATASQPWIVVTPNAGTTPAMLFISIDPAALAAQTPDTLTGTVDIVSSTAPQTPRRINVLLRYYGGIPNLQPSFFYGPPAFGFMDTPAEGATGLSGAIPITGWAMDLVGVTRITIYRSPVANEGLAPVYIGDAVRVFGSRPDLLVSYWNNPEARLGGWGYMLLSNVLPNGGNGTFTFYAYADDAEGSRALLGSKTVTIDNANATAPFGTIDVPAQGQTVSGTLINIGWALTPRNKTIPLLGSTITVFIDGVSIGPVSTYNIGRADVRAFFPGLNNSNGPEARKSIDTTLLSDGVHTIAWAVTDDAGAAAGLGSRYFTVNNGASSLVTPAADASRAAFPVLRMPVLGTDVWSRGGFDETGWATRVDVDERGRRTLHAARGQRVELFLDPTLQAGCGTYDGHLLTREVAAPLPFGSSLDRQRGIFRWYPGPETAGTFDFTFVHRGCDAVERTIPVRIVLVP